MGVADLVTQGGSYKKQAKKKKPKPRKTGSNSDSGSGGSDQDYCRSDSSPSDLTKNVFDEGPTNGSSDDSAMERIMNKSIESFSDTSSESNMMSAAKRGKHGVYPPPLYKKH